MVIFDKRYVQNKYKDSVEEQSGVPTQAVWLPWVKLPCGTVNLTSGVLTVAILRHLNTDHSFPHLFCIIHSFIMTCITQFTLLTLHFSMLRVAGVSNEEPLRLARHRVIAQAFAKRHDFNTAGRLSISLHSMHDDPLGKSVDLL